jgi:hypothetical protein
VGQQGFRLAGILDCFETNLANTQLHCRVEHNVLIATQEELEIAEQKGYESSNEYDSSDDELTIAELLNKKK